VPAGRKRKMKVGRNVLDAHSGRAMRVEDVLEIDIKPGWKDGTKVTFQGKGDETQVGQSAGDLQFVISQEPHAKFKRDGNDLVYTMKIKLKDALVGGQINIQHLSGTSVPVSFEGPVHPGKVVTIRCVSTSCYSAALIACMLPAESV
jgi:DnaJ homolog subfamily B member 4